MAIREGIYDLALRGLRRLAPMLSGGSGKVARGIAGRERDRGHFSAWAESGRDPARPLAWFHAPSVGEGLQARAVVLALRARRPDLQIAYSHFSPSAEGLARRMPADVSGYLPWDVQGEVEPALEALRPDLLVFTKTEVWPGLVRAAKRRGIPVVLVAATLPENAGRLRWPGRQLLRSGFSSLDRVLAISAEDGDRFRRLGVPADRIEAPGDPGMDAVLARLAAMDPEAAHLAALGGARGAEPPSVRSGSADAGTRRLRTVVAGSTWDPDEAVLVPALSAIRARSEAPDAGMSPRLRLIIAPHEPDPGHLEPLEARLREGGWRTARLSELERDSSDPSPVSTGRAEAIVVDRVGVLAELYTLADVAYVGGGFHSAGLHSVLEPAAAGVPVLLGPRHGNARAAGELVAAGGARVVADADDLVEAFEAWLFGPDAEARRAGAGGVARTYVEAHRGAAEATAHALDQLIAAGSISL